MAQEAASFKTEIEAISCGFTLLMVPSKPSTMTSGAASLSVPTPRIRIETPSLPGFPEVCETYRPALTPCNSPDVVVAGRDCDNSS